MKAPRLIHQMVGEPPVEGSAAKAFSEPPELCAMCGQISQRTAPADKVLGANFTDRGLFTAPHSTRVC